MFPAPGLRGGGVDRIWAHDEKRNSSNSSVIVVVLDKVALL